MHGVHVTKPTVQSPLVPSAVKETPIVDHNKRPASSDMLDIVECKRLKQEDLSNDSILPLPVNNLVFCMQRQLDNVFAFCLFQL